MPGKVLQVNENITLNMAIITLLPIVYSFKNPAFREEREWRGGRVVAMASADWSTAPSGRARNLPADKEQEPGGWVAWALHQMEYRALVDRIVPYPQQEILQDKFVIAGSKRRTGRYPLLPRSRS
jgi:hypothetical protein